MPISLILVFTLIGLAVVAFSEWLALHIFSLKTSKSKLAKIISIEAIFTILTSILAFSLSVPGIVNLVLVALSIFIWTALIKHLAVNNYSVGRAIGSYVTSFFFTIVFFVVLAGVTLGSVIQTFNINGNSLAPALNNMDEALVYKFERRPSDNATIVYELASGEDVVGRVEGTPGQHISISTIVVIDGIYQSLKTYTLGSNQY